MGAPNAIGGVHWAMGDRTKCRRVCVRGCGRSVTRRAARFYEGSCDSQTSFDCRAKMLSHACPQWAKRLVAGGGGAASRPTGHQHGITSCRCSLVSRSPDGIPPNQTPAHQSDLD